LITGIFGLVESSATQGYEDVAPTQEFFFFSSSHQAGKKGNNDEGGDWLKQAGF
jgi:hypothetical protein